MIDHTSGGADDDLSTAAQPGELDTVGLTAVDGQHMQARDVRRILTESLRYLQREFSGGRKHERLGPLLRSVDPGEDGHCERGSLAGAGLSETDDVPTSSSGGMVAAWIGDGDS